MALTCNDIIVQARAWSPLNDVLQPNPVVLLARIRNEQQETFSRIAGINRDRFQVLTAIASSSGSSGRVLNLTSLGGSPNFQPVERIIELTLASGPLSGTTLSEVDPLDQDAEYAPRYMSRGATLVEVGSDWGSPGSITVQLLYVFGMRDIDPTAGDLTQPISIPDQFSDLLSLPLAKFFHQSDPGRDPQELATIEETLGSWEKATGRRGAYLSYINAYSGAQFYRFDQPTPDDVRGVK